MPLTYAERRRRNLESVGTASGYRDKGVLKLNRLKALVAADFRCALCERIPEAARERRAS
jgi:hypothetical protein